MTKEVGMEWKSVWEAIGDKIVEELKKVCDGLINIDRECVCSMDNLCEWCAGEEEGVFGCVLAERCEFDDEGICKKCSVFKTEGVDEHFHPKEFIVGMKEHAYE